MDSFQSIFGPGWKVVGSESPPRVVVANVPKVASLHHLGVDHMEGVEMADETMFDSFRVVDHMEGVEMADEAKFVSFRKLDLTRKASCLDSSAMNDDEPPMKRRKHHEPHGGHEVRIKDEAMKHKARLDVTYRCFANLVNLPEEKLFSLSIFKGIQGPKFRRASAYLGRPENLSSPWEANYQSSERYEEDLSLLLQDFEAKSRHQFALKRKWPRDAELAALFLTWKLKGKEWRKVKTNGTYLQNLDNAWRAKINNFHEEKVFQVVWEYVTGMSREWDSQRHPGSYQVKSGVLLKPLPSTQRKQKFIDVDVWTRVKRHTGVDIDRWPIRRPSHDKFEEYRR